MQPRIVFPPFFNRDVTDADMRGELMFAVSPTRIAAWPHAAPDPVEARWTRDKQGGALCRLSRAGDVLVVAGATFVTALVAATGAVLWETAIDHARDFVTRIAFDWEARLVGLSYQDMHGNIELFDLATGELATTIDGSAHTEETEFRGFDFLSGNRVVAVCEDWGKALVFSIGEGAMLEEWIDEGSQPNNVVSDGRDNCFVSCAEVNMTKWHSGEKISEMDSTPTGYGITQCVALDPDLQSRRVIGGAFAHVAIFDADSCEAVARFSLPGEQYHIHNLCGNGAGTYGGTFQRNYAPEDHGVAAHGVFCFTPVIE
jgi:hypothetical protein